MAYFVLVGLVAVLFGSLLMHLLSQYPGYVLISVGDFAVEFSFWFGVTIMLFAMVLFWWTVKLLRFFLDSLAGSVSWIKESREKRAEKRTNSGLLHFMEGNWLAAKKDLLNAAKDVDKPLVHYLAAAKSAEHLGQIEETRFLLEQAGKFAPQNNHAVVVAQAQMQFSEGDYGTCLNTLKAFAHDADHYPQVLELYRNVYIQQNNWPELVKLLPKLKKNGRLSAAEFQELEENTHLSLFNEQAKATTSAEEVNSLWETLPKNMKKNAKLIGLYCTLLHRMGHDQNAEPLIRKALKSHWHVGLVELYGSLNIEPAVQLKVAEKWLNDHPQDAVLYFALGRICLRNSLWGRARDYFEKSLNIKERAEVYQELAALMAKLGDNSKSTALYKKGLSLA